MFSAAERVKGIIETDPYHPGLEVEAMSMAQLSNKNSGIAWNDRTFYMEGCKSPVISVGPASYHSLPCVIVHIKDQEGEAILVIKNQESDDSVFRILMRNDLAYQTGGCA